MKIIIEQIKTSVNTSKNELFDIAKARLKKTRAFSRYNKFYVYKESIDARNKEDIKLVYSVCCEVEVFKSVNDDFLSKHQIKVLKENELDFSIKGQKPAKKPLIVGFGPAGMDLERHCAVRCRQ